MARGGATLVSYHELTVTTSGKGESHIGGRGCLHLRVEEAGGCLDDTDDVVVNLNLVEIVGGGDDDAGQLQLDILRQHVEDEGVRDGLLLAGGDDGLVADGSQVAEDAGGDGGVLRQLLGALQGTAHEGDGDGLLLMVGDLDDGLSRATVDQLHAEDVSLGEGTNDIGLELGNGFAAGVLVKRLYI